MWCSPDGLHPVLSRTSELALKLCLGLGFSEETMGFCLPWLEIPKFKVSSSFIWKYFCFSTKRPLTGVFPKKCFYFFHAHNTRNLKYLFKICKTFPWRKPLQSSFMLYFDLLSTILKHYFVQFTIQTNWLVLIFRNVHRRTRPNHTDRSTLQRGFQKSKIIILIFWKVIIFVFVLIITFSCFTRSQGMFLSDRFTMMCYLPFIHNEFFSVFLESEANNPNLSLHEKFDVRSSWLQFRSRRYSFNHWKSLYSCSTMIIDHD